jgi:carboxyl-terminal processing protease
MGPTQANGRAAKRRGLFGRYFVTIIVLIVVFYFGTAVGSGRISLPMMHRQQSVSGNLPAKLNYDQVNQIYKSLIENYDGKLNEQQLEDGLKHGLAESTKDPYTVFFTAKEAKDFQSQLNNSFSGIGAQLGLDQDGNLEVIAPIDGLPADKAGIKAKDIIANINGESTAGMSVDTAVSKIRGPKGSVVKLQVVRNHTQPLDFKITRDDIKLPSVKTKILDGNIGYLQITSFSDDTVPLVQKAADDFRAKNVKGIVLDMRNDPGGLLDAAVKVSSLWVPEGQTILQQKRGGTIVDQTYKAEGGNTLSGIPTVILINSGSASASEITAGALHDNKQAYIIGEKSYGKGVVQQLVNFGDGSELKVTVASWYRPNGQNINHKGISPDKTVKISDADTKAITADSTEADKQAHDTQLQAALTHLQK